jgi:hypothetical protein
LKARDVADFLDLDKRDVAKVLYVQNWDRSPSYIELVDTPPRGAGPTHITASLKTVQ